MSDRFDPYRQWLGIPPQDQPPHHYRLLGIEPFESDPDVIANAADGRVNLLKGFSVGPYSAELQRLLNEVAAAKVCLLNRDKKADYDRRLKYRLEAEREGIVPARSATRRSTRQAGVNPGSRIPAIDPTAVLSSVALRGRRRRSRRLLWAMGLVCLLGAAGVVAALWWPGRDRAAPQRREAAQQPATRKNSSRLAPLETPPSGDVLVAPGAGTPATFPREPAPPGHAESEPSPTGPPTVPSPEPATSLTQPTEPAPQPVEPSAPELPASSDAEASPDTGPDKLPGTTPEPSLPAPESDQERSLADLLDPIGPSDAVGPAGVHAPGATPTPPGRLAAPDKAVRPEAEKRIREIFQKEFAEAGSPQQQAALAATLLARGRETNDDPVARFVLLELACRMAADAGQMATALEAVELLRERYEIDTLALKAYLMERAARSPQIGSPGATSCQDVVELAVQWIDDALAEDDFAAAGQFAEAAANAARKARDNDLLRAVAARTQELERQKQGFAAAEKALAVLTDDPADAGANLTAGRWYCFYVGKWEKGLPLLAKGNDPTLSQMAKRELIAPKVADQQAGLADDWMDLAKGQPAMVKSAMLARAVSWYQQALPGLTGLEKTRVEKAMEQIGSERESLGGAGRGLVQAGNVALASNGTRITGAVTRPEAMIDGDTTHVTPYSGFGYGTWPCQWTITFDKAYQLRAIRMMLYVGSTQGSCQYQYAIASSPDGVKYEPLVDRSKGEWPGGWQEIAFSPRGVKALRFHAMRQSLNESFCVIEFEAYCTAAAPLPK